jgi:hypothetical protein
MLSLSCGVSPAGLLTNDIEEQKFLNGAKKKSQFTERIITHGIWCDNSLDNATRIKKKSEVQEKRRVSQTNRVDKAFEAESRRVKKLQQQLASRQKTMAILAIEKYSCICIQTRYRIWRAKCVLHRLKTQRFIKAWILFKFYLRRRRRAAKIITKKLHSAYCFRIFKQVLRIAQAARRVQFMQRQRARKAQAQRAVATKRAATNRVRYAVNFAFSRAKIKIERILFASLEHKSAAVISRLWTRIKRKNRLKL